MERKGMIKEIEGKGKIAKRGKEIKKTMRKKERKWEEESSEGMLLRKRGKDWGEKEKVTEGRE